ncbi:MAG: DCC1-like thiol-disulfide oxidoreductase family protein [Bacteroidota bacterium]|nr:DCC1-like thiol-disulfide oxidoreductase family protein [Bacteroidota bacterium]
MDTLETSDTSYPHIVFYDGNCPMCNAWVKQILKADKKAKIKFTPLEGTMAHQILSPIFAEYLLQNTIVFYSQGQIYLRSSAILEIFRMVGFPLNFLSFGKLAPLFIRDGIYKWIAERRYRYGPRYDSCPLPPPEWKDRFI